MSSSSQTRRQRRKDARPGELTAAALALFVEKGFAATRLDDVAARAGVSKGTLYLYFDSKEELFKAVVREGLVPALAEGERMVAEFDGPAPELLRGLLRGWWQLIGSTPLGGIPKLMVAEARNFPHIAQFYYDEVIQRGSKLIAMALEYGRARGEFRDFDVEVMVPLVMAPLLLRVIMMHSLDCCAASCFPSERYIESAIDHALHALRPEPQAGR